MRAARKEPPVWGGNKFSLGDYDQETQLNYLCALYSFARVHGLGEAEEETIERLARSYNTTAEALQSARSLPLQHNRLRALLTRIQGAYLVRDAFRVALADGEVDEEERQAVVKLAAASGLSWDQMGRIRDWVRQELVLEDSWQNLLEE